MKKFVVTLLLIGLLAGCSGIPLTSISRLLRLQFSLLELDPAEFMLAVQVDREMVPPPNAVPQLIIAIHPAEAGDFDPIDKKLPMRFQVTATDALGLPYPSKQRRWLVYSLPRESQAELRHIQDRFRAMRSGKRSGTLSLGIKQVGIATGDPGLADTLWESWLQTSAREGFFELWSGTIADLRQQANKE